MQYIQDTSSGFNSVIGFLIDVVREGGFRKELGLEIEGVREVGCNCACRYLGLLISEFYENRVTVHENFSQPKRIRVLNKT